MPAFNQPSLEAQFIDIVSGCGRTMEALCAARTLRLSSWCIGAGAIRNLVWDRLHGFGQATAPADVDLVFYDAADPGRSLEQSLHDELCTKMPDLNWEAVNQASVHRWFQAHYPHPFPPLRSLEEGVASWPEYATCVGVSLTDADALQIIAPHGLDDLFGMVMRWNPTRVPKSIYEARMAQKRFPERWPKVKVLP